MRTGLAMWAAAALLSGAGLVACTSILGSDYRAVDSIGGAGGSSSGGAGASQGGLGGVVGGGGAAVGGAGGQGGAGGEAPALVDDGVVARYYLDEAASGEMVVEALDAVAPPLHLPISYAIWLSYTEVAGNRGLSWEFEGEDGAPTRDVTGTKVRDQLNGSKSVTVEIVADVVDHAGYNYLLFLGGFASTASVGLRTSLGSSSLAVEWNNKSVGEFSGGSLLIGRQVLHVVVDSDDVANDRVRLYADGVRQTRFGGDAVNAGEAVIVNSGNDLLIGNRMAGERSIEGRIFYAALYSSALTPEQISQNVEILLLDDDTPMAAP